MYKRIQFSKTYLLGFLVGCLFCVQPVAAQSDSLLQQLISANKVDSSLIQPPAKMLFTQRALWGTSGLLKNRYSGTDLVANRQKDLKIRRTMLQLHQIGGFVTIGGMIATNILATQIEHNASLKPYHRAAAYVSFASLATALVVIKF